VSEIKTLEICGEFAWSYIFRFSLANVLCDYVFLVINNNIDYNK